MRPLSIATALARPPLPWPKAQAWASWRGSPNILLKRSENGPTDASRDRTAPY
jgi:hypothetical protein